MYQLLLLLLFPLILFAKPQQSELQLMLQSFLYVNDLKDAYKTAKIAYHQNPNSYYWNKKMAEVSMWSGRSNEAIKYFKFMNAHKYNAKIEEKIINYGLKAYQYQEIEPLIINKALKNPNKKNIDRVLFIQNKTGEPQKAAEILTKLLKTGVERRFIRKKLLALYLEMGKLKSSQQIVKQILSNPATLSSDEAYLCAMYYYIKRDIVNAYSILARVNDPHAKAKFYAIKSDLAWYFKKYITAFKASYALYAMHKTRIVDYERIIYILKKKNLPLAVDISIDAYKKADVSYLFYSLAYYSFKKKKYKIIKNALAKLDKEIPTIDNNSQYWLIRAELYRREKEIDLEQYAFKKALDISPNNQAIQMSILSSQLVTNRGRSLELVLNKMAENPQLSPAFYFPLAQGYYNLRDINRAAYYIDLIKQAHLSTTQKIAFKFLEANVFLAKNNPNAFYKKLNEIKRDITGRKKRYQKEYLNAIFDTSNPDIFEQKLKEAKPYLTADEYRTFAYSWAMKHGAKERANMIFHKMQKPELWMRFTHALTQQNHSEIEDLILAYTHLNRYNTLSSSTNGDGQTALAQSMAYETLTHNDDSLNAYIQHLTLLQKRSDMFTTEASHLELQSLQRHTLKIENRTYLNESWYLYNNLAIYKNRILDRGAFPNTPNNSLRAGAGLRWNFQRGFTELETAYNSTLESYVSYKLLGEYRVNHYFNMGATLAKDIESDESTQLLLDGKKDMLAVQFTYNILPSTRLNTNYKYNRYSTQDGVDLGSGNAMLINLGYQIRNGYPDMHIGAFADGSTYQKTQGATLLTLPNDFYNIGLNFSYGMANSHIYTRVWRPFFELSSYYNSFISDYSYSCNIGYGGKVLQQDHLVVGASYSRSQNGTGDATLKLYLNYAILFTH